MSLCELATKHGSDKGPKHHNYTPAYSHYFSPYKDLPITLLEVGIGGYHYPDRGGNSLRMWRDYFTQAKIIGIDCYPKSFIIDEVSMFTMNQTDPALAQFSPDIIVDDASHINPLTIQTFKILFPALKNGGIYVIEDLETSYWTEHGYEGNKNPIEGDTAMNFLKSLTDQLNSHIFESKYHNEFSGQMEWIHFYPQIVFIKKK